MLNSMSFPELMHLDSSFIVKKKIWIYQFSVYIVLLPFHEGIGTSNL